MTISKKHQIVTGFVWLLIFPVVVYIAYHYFPVRELDWVSVLILFGTMFLTMLLPIQIQDISISLERWITLTIFLQYGIFAELILVQIALLILLFSQKTSLPLSHKFFVNSIVFGITSLVSGFVYYFTGGADSSLNFTSVFVYTFIYALTYTLMNNVLLKIYFKTQKRSFRLYSRGPIWDYISTFLLVPFGVSLYFLNEYLGLHSVLLIGVPFILVLLVMRSYNTSNDMQKQLSSASEIGHNLTDQLMFDEVLQKYIQKIQEIIPYEDGYVIDLRSQKTLIPLLGVENGQLTKQVKKIRFDQEKAPRDGLDLLDTKIFFNRKEMKVLKNITFDEKVRTVMTVPIIREHVTEGFLILTANRKNIFRPESIQIIDILTSYFAISLDKARHFEQTLNRSEQCGLTKLHNYRYLERKLEEAATSFKKEPTNGVSVVMLDIDHFKKINDTFGHESGNIILIELATILKSFSRKNDTVARYGGEEFVFIFDDCSKEEAVKFAEEIREKVARTNFRITPDLSKDRTPIDVNITISLGVATIPEDGKSAKRALRNADRALYIGGKQAGRNRVGILDDDKVNIEAEAPL